MRILDRLISKLQGTPQYSARGQAELRAALIEFATEKMALGLTDDEMSGLLAQFTVEFLKARWGIDTEEGDALAARSVLITLDAYSLIDIGPPISAELYADWVLEALHWSWEQ